MFRRQPDSGSNQTSCANCSRSIPATARFCPFCGQSTDTIPELCPQCGAENRARAGRCQSCGAGLETQTELDPGVGAVGQPALDQANVEFIGFSIRLAAWMVDFIILFIIQAALNAVGLYFVSLAVGPAYGVLFIGLRGQTPGKIALGIIVVDQHGKRSGDRPGHHAGNPREAYIRYLCLAGLLVDCP